MTHFDFLRFVRSAFALLLVLVGGAAAAAAQPAPSPGDGAPIPEYVVADPQSDPITLDDIAVRDRFWPFRLRLTDEWTPPGAERPLRPMGVLVRVNANGTVRGDFASQGRHDVPIDATDVVAAAERIRLGTETKMAPNLVLTIGNKLIDPTSEQITIAHIRRDTEKRLLLCVFADPGSDDFDSLLDALRPFRAHPELQIVLFPRTEALQDLGFGRVLREADFAEPFVRARYRASFVRSLLGDAPPDAPVVQVATVDGRLLFDEVWTRESWLRWPWDVTWSDRLAAALNREGD